MNIDKWSDERTYESVADIGLQAANDNHVSHRPAVVPTAANDNRKAWIERDDSGNVIRVVRAESRNPLRCRKHTVPRGQLPDIGMTPAMVHRAAVDEWRAHAPANDSDILPRRARNKAEGQPDMADCVGDLLLWRTLAGGPVPEWASAMIGAACNDNEPERENEEERPSLNEIMASMPVPVGELHWKDRRTGRDCWRHIWHPDDIEFRNGRAARLGGFLFSTATRRAPEEADAASNVFGPVRDMPRAATLLKYNPKGKGWRLVTEHARERRAGALAVTNRNMRQLLGDVEMPGSPVVGKMRKPKFKNDKERFDHADETKTFRQWVRGNFHSASLDELRALHGVGTAFKAGLPAGPTNLRQLFIAGVSTGKDMSDGDEASRVRRPVPIDPNADDNADCQDMLAAFRSDHTVAACVLDVAMTAQSYGDIAASVGKASPHTGKSALRTACETFRTYRLQFSPSRAA